MQPLLLVQTGEAPESLRTRFGGFADWFRAALHIEPSQLQVVRVDQDAPLPAPATIAGAVITGSAAMVTERAPWSERTGAWIRAALPAGLPMFGVCYGHQLMADALGGTVGWLPDGREIGTQAIARTTSAAAAAAGWLAGLPATFPAQTTHRQAVLAPPAGAEVLARSVRDPHQLLRYALNDVSTQFHPEFTVEHMRAYLAVRADSLRKEGLDPEQLAAAAQATEAARTLLQHFGEAALARSRAA